VTDPFWASPALTLILGLAALGLGCDRNQANSVEETALVEREPVISTGSVNQALGTGERVIPRLPSRQDQLLTAIREGDKEATARWIAEGAHLDGDAASLVAAVRGRGDLSFLDWLVQQGAPIDAPDGSGRTPLSWAAGRGSLDEVEYLLKRGADVAKTDQLGRAPLHFAVFSGEVLVVERLLAASADVNLRDALGTTALMYACSKNQAGMVQALRAAGADPTLKDKLGRTAAERAHGDDKLCKANPSTP
jgi:ankyrin repeat protein